MNQVALREAKQVAYELVRWVVAFAAMIALASVPFVVFGWRFLP